MAHRIGVNDPTPAGAVAPWERTDDGSGSTPSGSVR
jgi:hypothetical protein